VYDSSTDGTAAINLLFENGLVGTGLYSCEATKKQMAFEIFLHDRSIRLWGWDLRRTPETANEDIFVKEVSTFLQAIQSGDASLIQSDFESALKTQSVVDAIRRAIRTGRREQVIGFHEVVALA
jgi:predicted dehydrogenase